MISTVTIQITTRRPKRVSGHNEPLKLIRYGPPSSAH